MQETQYNIVHLLKQVARQDGNQPALVEPVTEDHAESISFSELWLDVCRISSGLKNRGLGKNDRILIMIPMSIDLYRLLLGVFKRGAVPVFIDPWFSYHHIIQFATFADLTGFAGISKSHVLRFFQQSLRSIPLTITTGSRFAGLPAEHTLSDLLDTPPNDKIEPVQKSDRALITFTGGTSGVPKGANRTHGTLLAQHRVLTDEFPPVDGADMTMFPVFALNNLANGVTTIIPDMDFTNVSGIDPGRIVRQMNRHETMSCTVSPPFLQRLVEHAMDGNALPHSLNRILTGGAPISDRQIRQWLPHLEDVDLKVVYGSTEAEPISHIDARERLDLHERFPDRDGTCNGTIVDDIEARTVPLDGDAGTDRNVPPPDGGSVEGSASELIVTGDHVCKSYFQNEEADRQYKITDEDGRIWHRMGDAGRIDSVNRFWFVDRVSAFIHRNDRWIAPSGLEEKANEIEGVKNAAAVGVPDEEKGEEVVLVVVTDASGIRSAVRNKFENDDLIVDQIVVRSEPLPVDPRHHSKTDYDALRKELRGAEQGEITEESSFLSRVFAYTQERFPLHEQGVLIVSYFSANSFLSQELHNPDAPLSFEHSSILGALTLLFFFFHLRVFDEHKDFEQDLKHHPNRVLQRGVVSLVELTFLGVAAIALEFLFSALTGTAALVACTVAFGYSLLMLKEFFVPEWLTEHRFTYTLSHMLIMPLLALMVWSCSTGEQLWQAPPLFWIYAFVGVFVTLNWEISRKIKAPEEERDGVYSYTKQFGTYGAAYLVLLMRVIDTAMVSFVGYHLGVSFWFYAVVVGLFLVCLVGFFQYRFDTNPETAARMETFAGFYIIAFDLTLAIELLRMNGLEIAGAHLI